MSTGRTSATERSHGRDETEGETVRGGDHRIQTGSVARYVINKL